MIQFQFWFILSRPVVLLLRNSENWKRLHNWNEIPLPDISANNSHYSNPLNGLCSIFNLDAFTLYLYVSQRVTVLPCMGSLVHYVDVLETISQIISSVCWLEIQIHFREKKDISVPPLAMIKKFLKFRKCIWNYPSLSHLAETVAVHYLGPPNYQWLQL